jgi:hypothetical protein
MTASIATVRTMAKQLGEVSPFIGLAKATQTTDFRTYNQGVIASGLASLYVATGSTNTELLTQAEITLDATITYLTQNNILKACIS